MCGGKLYRIKKRKRFGCNKCKKHTFPLTGTIFARSSTPLVDWFYIVYLMSQSKNGISSKEVSKLIGVGYKTAWRMTTQIRKLMKQPNRKLTGTVEADETYFGGKRRLNRRGRGTHKTPIIGVVKRNGEVRARVTNDVSSWTIVPWLQKNVRKGSHLMTDEFKSYKVKGGFGFRQQSINHSEYQYVRGNVHTNTIEGFWGQFKRSMHGTYHSISKKYLQSYLDQQVFLYNVRLSSKPAFLILLESISPDVVD